MGAHRLGSARVFVDVASNMSSVDTDGRLGYVPATQQLWYLSASTATIVQGRIGGGGTATYVAQWAAASSISSSFATVDSSVLHLNSGSLRAPAHPGGTVTRTGSEQTVGGAAPGSVTWLALASTAGAPATDIWVSGQTLTAPIGGLYIATANAVVSGSNIQMGIQKNGTSIVTRTLSGTATYDAASHDLVLPLASSDSINLRFATGGSVATIHQASMSLVKVA